MLTTLCVSSFSYSGPQNCVVAVGAEGWFHLFDLTGVTANKADSSSQHEFMLSDEQKPLFTQHIPANTKVILISDIGKAWFCFLTVHLSTVFEFDCSLCLHCRWGWPLWAGGGLHGPGGASFSLGGALWWFRCGTTGPAEEMAFGGAGKPHYSPSVVLSQHTVC